MPSALNPRGAHALPGALFQVSLNTRLGSQAFSAVEAEGRSQALPGPCRRGQRGLGVLSAQEAPWHPGVVEGGERQAQGRGAAPVVSAGAVSPQAHYSTGRVSASFTSTAMVPETTHEAGSAWLRSLSVAAKHRCPPCLPWISRGWSPA